MKLYFFVFSLLTAHIAAADPALLPPHARPATEQDMPGQAIDKNEADKLLKEREKLIRESIQERAKAQKKMAGKTEEERAQIFEQLAAEQKNRHVRIREIDKLTRRHSKDEAENALKQRKGGKSE
jgi:hypothetical protein